MKATVATVVVGLALVVALLWLLAFPRAPSGYHWPQHTGWGGGPAGLATGVLVERGGCVYLQSETGEHVGLLVWPMFASLARNGEEVFVRIDGRDVRMGEAASFGGGFYEGALPDIMAAARDVPCDGPYILVTGLADQ